MHFTQVNIKRDETTELNILVGAWEIPVLQAKHGDEHVTVGELKEFKGREWPQDARSEMQRLTQLYGMTGSGDNAQSFAERTYGGGSVGVKALEAAIADARKAAEPKRKGGKGSDLVGRATG